jgi:hypothetical protein
VFRQAYKTPSFTHHVVEIDADVGARAAEVQHLGEPHVELRDALAVEQPAIVSPRFARFNVTVNF